MRSLADHAKALLGKARHDLIAAEAIVAAGEAYEMACFHAQQAVEKSPKALLATLGEPWPHTHSLPWPREILGRHRADPAERPSVGAAVVTPSPYAVAGRYDDDVAPTPQETGECVALARAVYALAAQVVSGETAPEESP